MSTYISLTHYPQPDEIARALAEADEETQVAFLEKYARLLTIAKLKAISDEVRSFSEETESVALMRLARAINERDEGPEIEA